MTIETKTRPILGAVGALSASMRPLDLSGISPALRSQPDGVHSPNGSSVDERQRLHQRYEPKTETSGVLDRRYVSYQGNKAEPGYRWMKFKEGFSKSLVSSIIAETGATRLLDPFSGIGTAPAAAAAYGASGTGIEIMPVGIATATAINTASNGLDVAAFNTHCNALLERIESPSTANAQHSFRHVRITEKAFSPETEADLAKAREFISLGADSQVASMLDFACMSVLEDISFTRKDGQYLRWDYRSGRDLRSHVDKGAVLSLSEALRAKFEIMRHDLAPLQAGTRGGVSSFMQGSCLNLLAGFEPESFDLVVTSPPYANRYDYTRTYALELAWLGLDQSAFSRLRQEMVTATVENHSKRQALESRLADNETWQHAVQVYQHQGALNEVLDALRHQKQKLSNPNVVRLLEGYFLEMAYVIAELSRVLEPGGTIAMVNDNVQYHGEQVPVDQILTDFAEQSGLSCERILTLPRGKGNSSQQMGRFGRTELRKCVYVWKKPRG